MIGVETGFGAYNFFGDNKMVGYAPIGGEQNWSICIEVSRHEFKSSLDTTVSELSDIVNDVTHHLGKMADGDFTEEITSEYEGDFVNIAQSMKSIHDSLSDTLKQINQSVEMVTASAEQVANSSTSLSQGASEQADSI